MRQERIYADYKLPVVIICITTGDGDHDVPVGKLL